jgi:SnoaL-like domain
MSHAKYCTGDYVGSRARAPGFAQKAEIEAVNAKWIDFFNKGDFAGVASLYTEDATAFPPGSGIVKGRTAIEALWKSMAEQVSDPKLITLDVNHSDPPRRERSAPSVSRPRALHHRKSPANILWYGRKLEATGSSRPISGMTASRLPTR